MVKPRPPRPTVQCVDTYCQLYQDLFPEVRAYEAFKYLHVGLISNLKRKSLPAIATTVGLDNEQGLLHFMAESPWPAEDLEKRRLEIILTVLEGREIILIIDTIYHLVPLRFTLFVISNQGLRLLWFNLSSLAFAALFSGLIFLVLRQLLEFFELPLDNQDSR